MSDETNELLCKLLEERGEDYTRNDFGITWSYYSDPHTATESMDGTLIVTGLTPEQAIAATLDAPINEATGKPFDFNKLADRLDKDATLGSGKPFSDAIANLRKTVREAFSRESVSILVEGYDIMRAIDEVEAATLGSEPDEIELTQTYDVGFRNGVMAVFQQLEGIEDYEELQCFIAEYWAEGEGNDER